MKRKILQLCITATIVVTLSGCLANPPDTSTGETQAASLIFSDFELIAKQILSDRERLVSIINEEYDPEEVQAHDYYWLIPEDRLKIMVDDECGLPDCWWVIHQSTDDTIRFRQSETTAWFADFRNARIKESIYTGQLELLTDTLEIPMGNPTYNQAVNAKGSVVNYDPKNSNYDLRYSFETFSTLHAAKGEYNYEFCVGEIDFEVYFPNKPQPKDRIRVELYIDGTTPSRIYIWK